MKGIPKAYKRLQSLGEDKFSFICNQLLAGKSAQGLARQIQQEWKEVQDVAEKTLTQQLNRLRLHMAEGALGPEAAKTLAEGNKPQLIAAQHSNVQALSLLEEFVGVQRKRVMDIRAKEESMSGMPFTPLNAIMEDYRNSLIALQKMRFDLGLDEFKGVVSGVRGVVSSTQTPDGKIVTTHAYEAVQRQTYDAYMEAEKIFQRRGITIEGSQLRE